MDERHDTDGDELEPSAAAVLLEQATRRARRAFNAHPPLLTLFRGAVILAGYGVVWLSVRHQHPYTGPSGSAIVAVYGAVIVVILVTGTVFQRATSGVTGASRRQRGASGAAFGAAWIAVGVYQGALQHAGAGKAIVYGVFPASGQLLVVGAALAGYAAAKEDRRTLALAILVVALSTGAAFAGPAGAWAVMALGGCAIGIGYAALQVWERRA